MLLSQATTQLLASLMVHLVVHLARMSHHLAKADTCASGSCLLKFGMQLALHLWLASLGLLPILVPVAECALLHVMNVVLVVDPVLQRCC